MASISHARGGLTLSLAALVAALLLAVAGGVVPVVAGGNSDAAHACQQGGYITLRGTDGTIFKNAGDCVSYVARGGTITGVAADCVYTPGTSGCVEFDNVRVYLGTGAVVADWTSLSGMFSFAPVTNWYFTTTIVVTGSGTWTTSAGGTGTWTATSTFPYYETKFYNSTTSAFDLCGASDIRYVGVNLDVAGAGVAAGSVFYLQLRNATTGINYVTYQGFGGASGEPWGLHNTTNVTGVTLRC